jgi:hypothetical protein
MSRFRAYIAPLAENGDSHLDFIEITDDVDFDSMGSVERKIDNSDYDVGLVSFSDFSLDIRNEHGLYSVETIDRTIFPGERNGSLFRLTWQKQDFPSKAGMVKCGQFITKNTEEIVFEGILNDDSAQLQIGEQKVKVTILGKEAILSKVLVPYGSIANGMLFSEVILECLNQNAITLFFDVDALNIVPGLDLEIDDIASFQNKTVAEALAQVLLASSSILFVKDDVIYVQSREPSEEIMFEFFGQGSNDGIENIVDIKNIMRGTNRTFNFWTWTDTALSALDATSLEDNGVLKREIGFDFITDDSKKQSILDACRDEFKLPKQEYSLVTPITYASLRLFLLDRTTVDYPNVYFVQEGENLPIYGVSVYGEARYPFGEWSLNISPVDSFKIIGIKVNTKEQLLEFKMRKI